MDITLCEIRKRGRQEAKGKKTYIIFYLQRDKRRARYTRQWIYVYPCINKVGLIIRCDWIIKKFAFIKMTVEAEAAFSFSHARDRLITPHYRLIR